MSFTTDPSVIAAAGVVGYMGAAIYMGAYALLQLGLVRGRSYAYASLVLLASCCVAISVIGAFNPAVLAIQLFYATISIIGILRIFLMSRMVGIDEADRAFIRDHVPDMPREHVRRFLKQGTWTDLAAGETLTREGVPPGRLIFLAEGQAEVTMGGRAVGICEDTFVGELTFLTGEPATATVVTTTPGRALVFDTDGLKRLVRRVPEIKLALIGAFSGAIKAKLLRRNREALTAPEGAG
jgi:CRP-like cAMP-binding protein